MRGLCCLALVTTAALFGAVAPASAGTTGVQNREVLLCDFPDSPEPEFNKAHFEGLFSKLSDCFDQVSYGSVELTATVRDWRDLPQNRAGYGVVPGDGVATDLDAMAQDCVDAHDNPDETIDFTQVEGIDIVLGDMESGGFGNTGVGTDGQCSLDADDAPKCWAVTWIPAKEAGVGGVPPGVNRNGLALWAHEMGHSFGLAHSANSWWDPMSFPCGGSITSSHASDDPTYGCMPVSYTAAQKSDYPVKIDCCPDPIHFGLDWIPDSRTVDVKNNKAKTVKLERVQDPGPNGALIARALVKGSSPKTWITAEARVGAPGDAFEPPAALPGAGVVINRVAPACTPPDPPCEDGYLPTQNVGADVFNTPENGYFEPGEKFKGDGVSIKVVSAIGDHGFKVKVKNG